MIRYILVGVFLLFKMHAIAQKDSVYYWVVFKDKKGTPYNIEKPLEFLSQKAIDRRAKNKVEVTKDDLPVNPVYLKGVELEGGLLLYSSRWMNAAAILVPSDFDLSKIRKLSFVKSIDPLGIKSAKKADLEGDFMEYLMKMMDEKSKKKDKNNSPYGIGFTQIDMLNGIPLHNDGQTGQGITIAILDAGFRKLNELPGFQHLFNSGQIKGVYDFVELDTTVFDADLHGLNVLSCIATYDENKMIGTAPGADFYLFRTENAGSENPIEEANWVRAAEVADSIGVDIINSSLGYTTFDDSTMNYTYKQMNGKVSLASRAAQMAANRGILVFNAAGNEGDGKWKYIGAPADAEGIISVGGVDTKRRKASFSSFGPTADGRLKPEVSAMGEGTNVASSLGGYYPSNGTSFATPVLCGMAASLWSTNPQKTSKELMDAIFKSGSQFATPTYSLGYGIPDFELARIYFGTSKSFDYNQSQWVKNAQITSDGALMISFYASNAGTLEIEFIGKKQRKRKRFEIPTNEKTFITKSFANLQLEDISEIIASLNGETYSQKISLKL